MQKLEIIIQSDTWDKAVNLLASVDISEKKKSAYRSIEGYFIVSTTREEPLSEDIYEKIENSPCLAIMSDSDSKDRMSEILNKVYEVESLLKKLLIHTYDLVEIFYQLINSKGQYAKDKFSKENPVINKGLIDPITSHLTLGEMISILDYDFSWRRNKEISPADINQLAQSSIDFEDFKSKMFEKVTASYLWDVIAYNILKEPVAWDDIKGDLKKLKKIRNDSAHYKVITMSKKDNLIECANRLLEKITPKQKLTKSDLDKMATAVAEISRYLSEYVIDNIRIGDIHSSTLSSTINNATTNIINNIANPLTSQIGAIVSSSIQPVMSGEVLSAINALQDSIANSLRGIDFLSSTMSTAYKNVLPSIDPKFLLDEKDDEDEAQQDKDVEDGKQEPNDSKDKREDSSDNETSNDNDKD